MNYEEFKEQLIDYLKQDFPSSEYEYASRTCNKTNIAIDSLVVRPLDGSIAPIIYPEQSYELYREGYTPQFIFRNVSESLKRSFEQLPTSPEITLENAKKHLYCSIINKGENEHLLKNAPYEPFLDLAVVARWRVDDNGSFLVENDICKRLKLTSDEIMEMARANTQSQEISFQPMSHVIMDIMKHQGMPDGYMDEMKQAVGETDTLYVLTSERQVEGANTIICKDTLHKIYEDFGENFSILPSSRHELLLVPESKLDDVEFMEEMVRDCNRNVLANNDWLSDEVYHYDGKTRTVDFAKNRLHIQEATTEKTKSQGKSH